MPKISPGEISEAWHRLRVVARSEHLMGIVSKGTCPIRKMGISPEELSKAHIDGLIKNLQPAIKVFAGQGHMERIIEKINQLK